MSKKKKESATKPELKSPAPLLEEKRTFLNKAQSFAESLVSPQLKKELKGFGAIALIAVPGILVASAALVGTDMLLHGRVMPRTSIGGTEVGFVYNGEAAVTLQRAAEKYLKTPLNITVGGAKTEVTPEELGVQFSLPQSLISLPTYDFRNNSILSLAFAAMGEKKAAPFMTFDSEKVQGVIEQKLDLKKFRAQNAHIEFDKKTPTVLAEIKGKMIDKEQLTRGLKKSIKNMESISLDLALLDENPLITAQDLEPQKEFVANAVKSPLTLLYEGRQWKFDPSKHLEAVTFTQSPTVTLKSLDWTLPITLRNDQVITPSPYVALSENPNMMLDEEKIREFFETEVISKIERPTSDVKISTDEKKNIIIEGKGQNGVKVSREGLVASLNLALRKDIKRVQVPAMEEKANVTVSEDLQSLGIKNLIATGHSAFAGSHAGRITNIKVGTSKYNGLLIKQGETFSFNEHLGEVDGAHGFVPELVIKAEGTVPEFGGGLCQVSSTMYRAALFAGFPIVERSAHSYAVSYYAQVLGYGLDATIYPGVHDIKFINDSPAAIVVQAYTEGDQAYFKFYGTDDGRKVRIDGPYQGNYRSPGPTKVVESDKLAPGAKKQVEINHTGFDVTWYRYIVKDNKETKETLFTRYQAIPAKVMVGRGAPSVQASVPST